MLNEVTKPRGAFIGGILLSLVLLWCISFGPLPASAAPPAASPPVPACGCCNPASVAPECAPVCSNPQPTVIKDLTLLPGPSVVPAAAGSALLEREDLAPPLRVARAQVAGPPLYLRLHRLLN